MSILDWLGHMAAGISVPIQEGNRMELIMNGFVLYFPLIIEENKRLAL